jgi:hypothetical protein
MDLKSDLQNREKIVHELQGKISNLENLLTVKEDDLSRSRKREEELISRLKEIRNLGNNAT